MLRQQVLSIIAAFFALLLPALPAAGDGVMDLYSGSAPAGKVAAQKRGAYVMVSAKGLAEILGLETSEKGDTFIAAAGRNKLQLVAGAAAAWLDAELVPLAASTRQDGKDWLVESRSALKLFNGLLARSGKQGNLRWGGGLHQGTPSGTSPGSQAPDVRGPAETPTASGPCLGAIRWGIDDGKIRAVLDYEGLKPPEIEQSGGTVKTSFLLGERGVPDISSPYGEVKVSSVNFGDRLVLEFSSSLPLKEIIPLDSPPRIVIDYARAGTPAPVKTPPRKTVPVSQPEGTPRSVPSPSGRKGPGIVVIDAGHGGKDPGAVANGIREKDVNLAISRLLAAKLKKEGFDARLTRDRDVYLTLQRRADLANQWNADVFVSIHANALPPGRQATGMEIYLMALPTDKDAMQLALIENREIAGGNGETARAADKKTRMLLSILGDMQQNAKINESTGFAEYLFKEGSRSGIKMRRVAQAPFFVLRGAAMPAVLIETGFLTEKREARMLADGKYQDKMAASLARGIAAFFGKN